MAQKGEYKSFETEADNDDNDDDEESNCSRYCCASFMIKCCLVFAVAIAYSLMILTLGIIFVFGSLLTVVGGIIGGVMVNNTINEYTTQQLRQSCDNYDGFFNYGIALVVYSVLTALWILISICCFCGHLHDHKSEKAVLGVFITWIPIMIVWIVFAGFVFNDNIQLNKHCDSNSMFYKDMNHILSWLVVIMAIELIKIVLFWPTLYLLLKRFDLTLSKSLN
eukprot:455628_1